jgi:hypothetical protein
MRSPLFGSSASVLIAASALATASAAAQEPVRLDPLLACRSIEDGQARLACFDREAARLAGDGSGRLVAVDMEDVEAVERDSFGLELPSLPRLSMSIFGARDERGLEAEGPASEAPPGATVGDDSPAQPSAPAARPAPAPEPDARVLARTDDGQIDQIALIVDEVRLRGYDTVYIDMANGQVWEVIEGRNVRRLEGRVRPGTEAIIRRAAVGSYLLQFEGRGPAYRVIRRD